MYCRHCGKELRGEPNYCRYCGWQLHSGEQDKNSYIYTIEQENRINEEGKKKQEDFIKLEKKKLRRETSLYTAFSIFVIFFFMLSIIIIQNNPSLVHQDKQEESTQAFVNEAQEVSDVEIAETSKQVSEEEQKLGSSKLLEGDNILISIFVDINGNEWRRKRNIVKIL